MNFTIATLKALALRGAASGYITVSTRELGKELGVSQQTASNRLMAMEDRGLVRRRLGLHGQDITLTREGMDILRREFADYQRIFSEPGAIVITGTVASGLGEGQYYLNKPGYRSQIEEKLGFAPFDGTLNVRVTEAEMAKLSAVPRECRVAIDSFRADGRTYGGAQCIPVRLGESMGAIIMPERSHHADILEIISGDHLRSRYGLEDGARVDLTVEICP